MFSTVPAHDRESLHFIADVLGGLVPTRMEDGRIVCTGYEHMYLAHHALTVVVGRPGVLIFCIFLCSDQTCAFVTLDFFRMSR